MNELRSWIELKLYKLRFKDRKAVVCLLGSEILVSGGFRKQENVGIYG